MISNQSIDLSIISLEVLEQQCNLSARAISVCKVNKLTNLAKIIYFCSGYEDLPKIRGGGAKTNQELQALYKDYYENTFFYENLVKKELWRHQHGDINPALIDIPITKKNIINNYIKLKINALSARVAHVVTQQLVHRQDFDNFTLNFLKDKSALSKFRNIGQKSLQELTLFVETVETFALEQVQLEDEIIESEPEFNEVRVGPTTKLQAHSLHLSPIKKQIISTYIQKQIKKFPQKLRHWVSGALEYQITFDIFVETFSTFKSTGMSPELLHLIAQVENKVLYFLDIDDEKMLFHGFMNLLNLTFDLKADEEIIFLPIIEKKTFPLFHFFDYLIEHQYLVEEKHITIFRHRTGYFEQAETLYLDTIGKQMNLTRERVRQLSISLETKIEHWWQFLLIYSADIQFFTNYKLPKEENIIILESSFIQKINQAENTHFSNKFFNKTFSQLYNRSHILFGEAFDDFHNTYLIEKNLFDFFSFDSFFETIYQQISDKLYEDLSLDMDGFLYNFIKGDRLDLLTVIRSICEKIIINEFFDTIEFDFDNNIIFKRNVKINSSEIIIEILRENGTPMKVEDIYEIYNNKYGKIAKSYENIRSIIGKDKDTFIYFGRSSTYGLAEWEETQENIKGGTIRDIAETYLNQFDEPKHISELTEYVLKYRPKSNFYSINTNLLAEPTKRFQEFKGGFWGLYHKKYENIDFKEIPTFFLRYVKIMIRAAEKSEYEIILANLCKKFGLKSVQVQYLIEKNIKDGILRRENNLLIIC
jgi:hypothetical protein